MTKKKTLELAVVIVALMLLSLLFIVPKVDAIDIQETRVAYSKPGTDFYVVYRDSSLNFADLPKAYMVWSGDGAAFWIRRTDSAGSWEDVELKIPTNSSLILPIRKWKDTTYWRVQIGIGMGAVTDSVFVVPMDQ